MKNFVRVWTFARHQSDRLDDWCDQSVVQLGIAIVIALSAITIVANVGLGVYAHAVLLK